MVALPFGCCSGCARTVDDSPQTSQTAAAEGRILRRVNDFGTDCRPLATTKVPGRSHRRCSDVHVAGSPDPHGYPSCAAKLSRPTPYGFRTICPSLVERLDRRELRCSECDGRDYRGAD